MEAGVIICFSIVRFNKQYYIRTLNRCEENYEMSQSNAQNYSHHNLMDRLIANAYCVDAAARLMPYWSWAR